MVKRKRGMLDKMRKKLKLFQEQLDNMLSGPPFFFLLYQEASSSDSTSTSNDYASVSDTEVSKQPLISTVQADVHCTKDGDLTDVLGTDPNKKFAEGKQIPEQLATRWTCFLQKGFDRQMENTLLEQWNFSTNCSALQSPIMNPEILSLLPDFNQKQDTFFSKLQDQLGLGLSVLGQVFDTVKSDNIDPKALLSMISDASKFFSKYLQVSEEKFPGENKIRSKEQGIFQEQRKQPNQSEEEDPAIEIPLKEVKYAGQLKFFKDNWEQITYNKIILQWLGGYKIPFKSRPFQAKDPAMKVVSVSELTILNTEIKKLLLIGAIRQCNPEKSHSTRHAASSAAFKAGVSIDTIRKSAGWSNKSNVFHTFYHRPLKKETEFDDAIVGLLHT
ncbi:unnamed protein product [Psylliodes chrysocephalus]|uniref:Tyr recombinase domain-containing protein n=1 Tax=Psylliodes chrysocephalus TaxID=3402493 RepID=A0A9P0CQU7_9CUCU|nr:unnamed protein product [Psylliodes chrysocephala]